MKCGFYSHTGLSFIARFEHNLNLTEFCTVVIKLDFTISEESIFITL